MKRIFLFLLLIAHPLNASVFGPERVVFHTIAGDIVFALFPDKAPKHVEQFLRLVRKGAYDSTHFYRLEAGFVLQTSLIEDRLVPASPALLAEARPLPLEVSDLKHTAWTLSMARADGNPDSATSSFSILLGAAPHLDGQYTIFGQVVDGFDVITELSKVPLSAEKKPGVRLTIQRAQVVSQRDLAGLQLAPVVELFKPKPIPAHFLGGLALILIVSLGAFFAKHKLHPQQIVSFHLLNVLIAAFLLFAALLPAWNTHAWLGGFLSVAMLGTFWLMSRFENAR